MDNINKNYIPKDQGIYMIWSSIKPDYYYFGSSTSIRRRYNEHLSYFKRGKHHNIKLQNHINKYGLNDLNFCVHIVDNSLSNVELRKLEQKEILYFNTFKKGFNLTENTEHPIMSDEGRLRVSLKAKERQSTQEYKNKLALKYRGTKSTSSKLTKENIEYIRKKAIIKGIKCMNIRILAKELNVCTWTIQRMLRGRTYKND